jgi:hypothetical protein
MDIQDFLASPGGIAVKAALVAAGLDFVFGVFFAVRDGSFALDAVAAWLRKHLAGRVFPISVLAAAGWYTQDPFMITAAGAALATYAAETTASIYSSITSSSAGNATKAIPQD